MGTAVQGVGHAVGTVAGTIVGNVGSSVRGLYALGGWAVQSSPLAAVNDPPVFAQQWQANLTAANYVITCPGSVATAIGDSLTARYANADPAVSLGNLSFDIGTLALGTLGTAGQAGDLLGVARQTGAAPGVVDALPAVPEETTGLLDAGTQEAGSTSVSRAPDAVTGCSHCFPAGTGVATPHGERAIETLRPGDLVLAENPASGRVDREAVQAVLTDGIKPLLAIDLSDGSAITVTASHPFWVVGGVGVAAPLWQQAGHLRVGDELRTASGMHVQVVRLRHNVGRAPVYTLTVAHDHTFFVGNARVLVHNSNCPGANGVLHQATLPNFPQVAKYEWHHPFPKYLGGAEHQPLVALPDWYHDLIHNELDRTYPRWRGTNAYTGVSFADKWRALSRVYNKYPLDIDPTTGQLFGWRQ